MPSDSQKRPLFCRFPAVFPMVPAGFGGIVDSFLDKKTPPTHNKIKTGKKIIRIIFDFCIMIFLSVWVFS